MREAKKTLTVVNKEFLPAYEDVKEPINFGLVNGRDEWKGVSTPFVIGMPRPSPKAARDLAPASLLEKTQTIELPS
jgi:hypothetical protein